MEVGGVNVANKYDANMNGSGCEQQGPISASGSNAFKLIQSHGEQLDSQCRRAYNGDLYKAQIEEGNNFISGLSLLAKRSCGR
jgi:hypothetical protein